MSTPTKIPETRAWEAIASSAGFQQLMKAKTRFIVAATAFFVVYYFAFLILVGYAPALMSKPVFGPVNVAYLFALSQFFVAWLIAWLYIRAADRFDAMARTAREHTGPVADGSTQR